MKVFLLSIFIVASLMGSTNNVTEIIANEPLIIEAEVVEDSDTILVAILTKPIFLKSECIALETRLQLECEKLFPDKNILITRDSVTFYALERALKNDDKDTIHELMEIQKNRIEEKTE